MNYWPYLLVFLMTAVGVLGDSLLKRAGEGATYISWSWFIPGFVVYALTAFGWFYILKEMKLVDLGVAYALSNVVLLVIVGVVVFGERLNMYEIIGFAMAVTSIVLLARFA